MKKGAGAAFVMGAAMPVGSTVADEGDETAVPDPGEILPEPYASEEWTGPNAGPGHTRHVSADYEFDSDDLGVAWTFEHGGNAVVADGTVYVSSSEGVFALDEEDGSVLWETAEIDTDIGYSVATVTAAYGSLYLTNEDGVIALDQADGSLEWSYEIEWEEIYEEDDDRDGVRVYEPTVAYGAVFIVDDGTLYALEADDGSVRWERESFTAAPPQDDQELGFNSAAVAVSDGRVYSNSDDLLGEHLVALDVVTGESLWSNRFGATQGYVEGANSAAVAMGGRDEEYTLHDPETGDRLEQGWYMSGLVFDDEIVISSWRDRVYATGFNTDAEWEWWSNDSDWNETYEGEHRYFSRPDAIVGDTLFFDFSDGFDDELAGTLAAVNKYDGEFKWTIENDRTFRAFSNGTFYLSDDELVALRELEDEDDDSDDGDGEDHDDEEEGDGDENGEDGEDGEDGEGEDEEEDDGDEGEDDKDDEEPATDLSISVSSPETIALEENTTFDVTVQNAGNVDADTSITLEVCRVCRAIGAEIPAGSSKTVRIGVYGGDVGREGEVDWTVTVDGERETGTVTID